MKTHNASAPQHDQVANGNGVALILIDLINCFDFPGGRDLHDRALDLIEPIRRMRSALEAKDSPVIYINDNFGEWHSERSRLVQRAIDAGSRVSESLAPADADYFIIKPQFSGFYSTNLQVLLPKLGVRRLVLAGVATEICVLFTAADAHMRDYRLWVPADLVAGGSDRSSRDALAIMADAMGAETRPTVDLDLADWLAQTDASP